MIKAVIIGATGYTGVELLRLLHQHPKVQVTCAVTETYAGQEIAAVYPHLKTVIALKGQPLDLTAMMQHCDVAFVALPHGHAVPIATTLLAAGKKVIDLGADFRLRNSADYQQWYQQQPAPDQLLKQAVYGLPEIGNKAKIAAASLLANPGCYPTASILGALPALKAGLVDAQDCIFDAKSGISGAGRSLALQSHYCEVAENLTPYKLAGAHRHVPEIEQELGAITRKPITVQFTPHLIPIVRGLLVTAYFKLTTKVSQQAIEHVYQTAYKDEKFIRISMTDTVPQIKHVRGTNYCDIGVRIDVRTQRLIVVSVIDNLIKGAAGQAIQNMNLMYQLPETTGLENHLAIFP